MHVNVMQITSGALTPRPPPPICDLGYLNLSRKSVCNGNTNNYFAPGEGLRGIV